MIRSLMAIWTSLREAPMLVDKLIVTVFVNPSKKTSLFSIEERLDMLRETTKDIPM